MFKLVHESSRKLPKGNEVSKKSEKKIIDIEVFYGFFLWDYCYLMWTARPLKK